ncbi:MAG: hypothetical protein R3A80_13175 [Bdellovibrionota bacterium]
MILLNHALFSDFLRISIIRGVLLKAQMFNLEDEDKVQVQAVPTTSSKLRVPSTSILAPAGDLPMEKEDQNKFDKVYGNIVKALKANDVEGATKIMSDYDVLTKQRVVYRLMKENPDDFKQQ